MSPIKAVLDNLGAIGGSIVSIVVMTIAALNFLATQSDLEAALKAHSRDPHDSAVELVASLEKSVARILESQLAQQIDTIYRARCVTGQADLQRGVLRKLRREYRELTGYSYEKPSCRELGVEQT